MTTSLELKESLKVLKELHTDAEKKLNKRKSELNKIKNEYSTYEEKRTKYKSFGLITMLKDKYDSFEALITHRKWSNSQMSEVEYEFLFNELGFTDTEFFSTFMRWDKKMFEVPIEDRKCVVCLSYYNFKTKRPKKFANCVHKVCTECYPQIKSTDGFKCCVICRKSEGNGVTRIYARRFTHTDGKIYFRSRVGIIYNTDEEEVGKWNTQTNTIDFNVELIEEEDDEEYEEYEEYEE
jgi:hypothetical protein